LNQVTGLGCDLRRQWLGSLLGGIPFWRANVEAGSSSLEHNMPAITPSDISDLPRISDPASHPGIERPVLSVTDAPLGLEGEGFPVRRAFAGVSTQALDPFVHLDQMGEVDYAPGEPKGTPWHPHRGFETVTYMIDGTFEHQDSNGGGGLITDGDTQWMTAGQGILHIERPPEQLVASGGRFHGLQLWVNLPSKDKMIPPAYQSLEGDRVALLASPDAGALVRVIAGQVAGHRGPGSTHTPMAMVHATVAPGAQLNLPWDPTFNALVYVLAGFGTVGPAGQPLRTGQLAVMGSGAWMRVSAASRQETGSPQLELLFLGGRPIGEPVVHYGPFVMNTRGEIDQAMRDFRAGRLGQVPAGQ
jgi:quercetin 2,3-dioxygenase